MAGKEPVSIAPADGKLGVLLPGLGAVSTTFIAGVEAIKRGIGEPIGSLTQLGRVRLGKRSDGRDPLIKDFVPLAGLDDLEFAAWDIFEDNAYQAARKAAVLDPALTERVREPLEKIVPMEAVFDRSYIRRIKGPNVKEARTKMEKAEMLMDDIRQFQKRTGVARTVMIWCGSTEVFHKPSQVHETIKKFERGLQ
ncbi:MAG TPA: inositol-3-phosphate synthase, partial [Candidatus Binataceae bacterium]|nr:inositol-3-phosphate synthase [Candidatus Binataceae bacterium]